MSHHDTGLWFPWRDIDKCAYLVSDARTPALNNSSVYLSRPQAHNQSVCLPLTSCGPQEGKGEVTAWASIPPVCRQDPHSDWGIVQVGQGKARFQQPICVFIAPAIGKRQSQRLNE